MNKKSFKKLLSATLSLVFSLTVVASIPFTASASYEAYSLDGSIVTEATFILDPGHGGEDPGAMAAADENGYRREEADDNLSMALKVAAFLEEQGETVALTRITDKTVALIDRSYIANAGDYRIFCSLHRNSASNVAATGIETYYFDGLSADSSSAKIAAKVHENILKASNEIVDRKVKKANFSVLRETNTCAILIESLFMSNPDNNVLYDKIETDLAKAIATGLIQSKSLAVPHYALADKYLPADLGDSFTASVIHTASGAALTNTGTFDTVARPAVYDSAQLWKFEKMNSKNAYKLTSLLDQTCLDVASAQTSNGTNLMVWEDNGNDCQRYYFYEVNGIYFIKAAHCNNDIVIDIDAPTQNAQIWDFGIDNTNQQFSIIKEISSETKLELTSESKYSLNDALLTNVKANTLFDDFASNFKNSVKITDREGNEISADKKIGTGFIVLDSGSDDKAEIIVLGDVNGDGELTSTDYLQIKSFFLDIITLEGIYFTAANIDGKGEIDATDYLKLKSHFLGIIDIYE